MERAAIPATRFVEPAKVSAIDWPEPSGVVRISAASVEVALVTSGMTKVAPPPAILIYWQQNGVA